MPGRQLPDALERRGAVQRRPAGENVPQGLQIHAPRDVRIGKYRFDFRAEEEPKAVLVVEQRADPHPVPGQEQFLFSFVPDGKRELPVQALEHVRPELFVQVHEHFGIALSVEAVPPRL